jgi:chromo domain-containing protein 1
MTERTVLQKTRPLEDDAISITSTQSEEYSSEEEFLVERVLAERRGADDKVSYLIFWAGYPEEKSTWEPRKNIQDPAILESWEERKGEETRGTKPAFDVAGFEARIAEIEKARLERHQRRKAKRRRLGIPVSPSEESEAGELGAGRPDDSDSSEAVETNELPSDERVARTKAKQRPRSQKEAPARRGSNTASSSILPHPGRSNTLHHGQESESDSSDLDRDPLVGNKKKAQQKALEAIRLKRLAQNGPEVSKDESQAIAENTLPVSFTRCSF